MFEEEKQEKEKVSGAPELVSAPVEPVVTEAEDILYPLDGQIQPGELKSALAGQKLKPIRRSAAPLPPESVEPEIEISPPLLSKKGLFLIIGVVLVAAVAIGVGYSLWSSAKKNTAALPPPPSSTANQEPLPPAAPAPIVEEPVTPAAEQPINQPLINTDTDGDGLSDQEEKSLGTDAAKQDTDEDGLTDYEEVVLWKTNPLAPDTDNDTFLDGMEVKNGFNPLGSGKLLQLPK